MKAARTARRIPGVDMRLEGLGRTRRARVTVSSHVLAIEAVRGTPLVATMLRRSTEHLDSDPGLTITRAPDEIGTLAFSMARHPRLDNDPAHQWLRDAVRNACSPPS